QRVLFGTPQTCAPLVAQLRVAGVDEIACQIDFGIDIDLALQSLPYLNQLRELCNIQSDAPITYPVEVRLADNQLQRSSNVPVLQTIPAVGTYNEINKRPDPKDTDNLDLEETHNVPGVNDGVYLLQTLQDAHTREHSVILTAYVKEQVADVLNVPVEKLELERPLTSFGFDSLMAIQLKNCIDSDLQLRVPVATLLQRPTIVRIVDQLLALVRNHEAIGEKRSVEETSLVPVSLPVSHNQKALWFLARLAPESAAYNVLYTARVRQCLDVVVLRRALRMLAVRYPILTATYTVQDDEPVQYNLPGGVIPLEVIEVVSGAMNCAATDGVMNGERGSGAMDCAVMGRLLAQSNRPIDLRNGPILRFLLYRYADGDHILGLIVHHIAVDFWALELLLHELSLLYAVEKTGLVSSLPPVQWQNADYVRWQQAMLDSQEGEEHWRYWQDVLAGELPMLNLPTDRPRPPVQTYEGALHSVPFSADLTQRLRAVAHETQVTLFTLVLTAYQVLLHRYTQQDDIVVATPALGRTRSEWKRVIGYLANPVVVRARFAHDISFKDLLQQTKHDVLSALEHQDFPFPLLVERLQPQRDPSYSPIFQTMFIWDRLSTQYGDALARVGQGALAQDIIEQKLVLEPLVYGQQGAPFDLSLTIFEIEGQLTADWRYNVDLFDATTIVRIAEHFLILLDSIANDPDRYVSELSLLPDAERKTILLEWNATQCSYPQDLCLHQLFEQQVAQTPDAIAVVFGGYQMSYYELDCQANQLAHRLLEERVGPEQLVGIFMERSPAMLVSILAIFKAGGAYLPLDLAYPEQRLHSLVHESKIRVILTQRPLHMHFQQETLTTLIVEDLLHTTQPSHYHTLPTRSTVYNLAYVIYTSGSTGLPKGAMITHRGMINHLYAKIDTVQLTSTDSLAQTASQCFDISVWQFLAALLVGGQVCILPDEIARDPGLLFAEVRAQGVTVLELIPSLLQVALDLMEQDERGTVQ
ncbi:MAG: hypothetical protein E6J34_14610, partial [Chloroflexi bacterium]